MKRWKLLHGESTSCGCKRAEKGAAYLREHLHKGKHLHTSGYRRTPEYTCWQNMKERCLNPKNRDFKSYGGRGIKVCEEWLNDFSRFLADMGQRPHPKLTIERGDNDGDYEPKNCSWATRSVQNKNQRRWKGSP